MIRAALHLVTYQLYYMNLCLADLSCSPQTHLIKELLKSALAVVCAEHIGGRNSSYRISDCILGQLSSCNPCFQVTSGVELCCDVWVKLVVVAGQKLQSAGVIVDTFPLHSQEKLRSLSKAWYSGNQLSQPLGEWTHTNTRVCPSIFVRTLHWIFHSFVQSNPDPDPNPNLP